MVSINWDEIDIGFELDQVLDNLEIHHIDCKIEWSKLVSNNLRSNTCGSSGWLRGWVKVGRFGPVSSECCSRAECGSGHPAGRSVLGSLAISIGWCRCRRSAHLCAKMIFYGRAVAATRCRSSSHAASRCFGPVSPWFSVLSAAAMGFGSRRPKCLRSWLISCWIGRTPHPGSTRCTNRLLDRVQWICLWTKPPRCPHGPLYSYFLLLEWSRRPRLFAKVLKTANCPI